MKHVGITFKDGQELFKTAQQHNVLAIIAPREAHIKEGMKAVRELRVTYKFTRLKVDLHIVGANGAPFKHKKGNTVTNVPILYVELPDDISQEVMDRLHEKFHCG